MFSRFSQYIAFSLHRARLSLCIYIYIYIYIYTHIPYVPTLYAFFKMSHINENTFIIYVYIYTCIIIYTDRYIDI